MSESIRRADQVQLSESYTAKQSVLWRPGWDPRAGQRRALGPLSILTVLGGIVTFTVPGGWGWIILLMTLGLLIATVYTARSVWLSQPGGVSYDAWCRAQVAAAAEQEADDWEPRCITFTDLPPEQRPVFGRAVQLLHDWHTQPAVAQGWVEPGQVDAAHRALWTGCLHLRYAARLTRRAGQAKADGLADTEQYAELEQMHDQAMATATEHFTAVDTAGRLLRELGEELMRQEAHRKLIADMETYRGQTPATTGDAAASADELIAQVRAIREVLQLGQPPTGPQK